MICSYNQKETRGCVRGSNCVDLFLFVKALSPKMWLSASVVNNGDRFKRSRDILSQVAAAQQGMDWFLARIRQSRPEGGGSYCGRVKPGRRISAAGRAALPALLAESHFLGELGTGLRVVRGDHRVIDRQAPLLPVLLGRHVVLRAQVTLKRLELLSILETDDVVGRHGLFQRNRRLRR